MLENKTQELDKASEELARKILWGLYHQEQIITKAINPGWDSIEVVFQFPEYKKTKDDLWHVSINQIQEAITEWLYCAIWYNIKQWNIDLLDFESFQNNRQEFIYRADRKKIVRMPKWEDVLKFKILETSKKKDLKANEYLSVIVKYSGFAYWETECIFELWANSFKEVVVGNVEWILENN